MVFSHFKDSDGIEPFLASETKAIDRSGAGAEFAPGIPGGIDIVWSINLCGSHTWCIERQLTKVKFRN
jgi:hypothetical protein